MDAVIVLVLVVIVAVIWRGPRTLPQIGAMLGRGVREVRREIEATSSGQASDGSSTGDTARDATAGAGRDGTSARSSEHDGVDRDAGA